MSVAAQAYRAGGLLALALLATAPGARAQARAHDAQACQFGDPSEIGRTVPGCRVGADGYLVLDRATLRQLSYDEDGMALLYAQGHFYYVRRDGRNLPVIVFDNGPDYFVEGLTRARLRGRIGFYDRDFRQVVPPVHDFAWPFENGVARVCDGCRPGTPGLDGHTPLEGGRWYYIDRNNREVPEPQR